ncbi:unnamed protein product [Hermetia illucens]|uniref:Uncharacterized protein n=1 Tax=Hermetia illucens TaxID=343691 RepID=A0A7R8UWZ7_HERIL|nr:unnamed protein product [Hermetia illucens]
MPNSETAPFANKCRIPTRTINPWNEANSEDHHQPPLFKRRQGITNHSNILSWVSLMTVAMVSVGVSNVMVITNMENASKRFYLKELGNPVINTETFQFNIQILWSEIQNMARLREHNKQMNQHSGHKL